MYGRVIFITILLHFHYFISLETANNHKSHVFPFRISSGNLQFESYIFCFTKEFLETLCKCIYLGF